MVFPPDLLNYSIIKHVPRAFLNVNKGFNALASKLLWDSLKEDSLYFPEVDTDDIIAENVPLYRAISGNRPEYVKQIINHSTVHPYIIPAQLIQELKSFSTGPLNIYTRDILCAIFAHPRFSREVNFSGEVTFDYPFTSETIPSASEMPIFLDALHSSFPKYFTMKRIFETCASFQMYNVDLEIFIDFMKKHGMVLTGSMHVDGIGARYLTMESILMLIRNRIFVPTSFDFAEIMEEMFWINLDEKMAQECELLPEHFDFIDKDYTFNRLPLHRSIASICRAKSPYLIHLGTCIISKCMKHHTFSEFDSYSKNIVFRRYLEARERTLITMDVTESNFENDPIMKPLKETAASIIHS